MYYSIVIICCLTLLSISSFASTKGLVDEFLEKSSSIKSNRYRIDMAGHEYEAIYNKMPLVIGANSTYASSDLDTLSATTKQTVKSDIYSLSASKDFIWGGNFTVSTILSRYDRSEMNAAALGGSNPIATEYHQKLEYSQSLGANFLGKDDRLERLMADQNLKYITADSGKIEQAALLQFYNLCIDTKLKKTFVALEKGAYFRSIKRKNLISKRVRDGLRERADLLQAKMEEISKKEYWEAAKIELGQALDLLSSNLHRKVSENEIIEYSFNNYLLSKRQRAMKIEKNYDLVVSNEKLAYLKTQHDKADYKVFPTITLNGSFATNDFNESDSTAIQDGTFGKNKETKVGVTVTWPLGFSAQKHNRAKAYVQLQSEQYYNKTIAKNIENSASFLNKELDILEINLKSAGSRRDLAFKLLKEYNKLYNLGKADIDQVIRAEENLITTEKSYGNYMAMREKMVANVEALKGGLSEYLLN